MATNPDTITFMGREVECRGSLDNALEGVIYFLDAKVMLAPYKNWQRDRARRVNRRKSRRHPKPKGRKK